MSEVQSRPSGTMSPERRYGIAISVALILGGLYWALTGLTEDTKTTQDSYPVDGGAVTIETGSTDVEIRSGEGTAITVDRRFERNVFGSDPSERYDDGTLKINASDCGFISFGCDTHYVVSVPKDVKLTVKGSSGDLTVSGVPGGADLKTSSGSITVRDVGGSLRLESSSGRLEAADLTATTVSTKSSSGDVDLDFASAPQSVEAESSSGDVEIQVPSGEESYRVDIDTSSGDESANVKIDPSATRTIKADTSSGDVTVEYDH